MNINSNIKTASKSTSARLRLAIFAAIAGLAMMSTSTAQALTLQETIDLEVKTIKCAFLVFTDPETHLVECGVNDAAGAGFDWSGLGLPSDPIVYCIYKSDGENASDDCEPS